jgi:hypothetical protein
MVVSWGGYFEPKDLLQFDGTIIAGILILMTVSAYYQKKYTLKFWGHPREIISLSVLVFGISAIAILATEVPNEIISDDTARLISINGSAFGLFMLMWGIVFLLKAISKVEASEEKKKDKDANFFHDG